LSRACPDRAPPGSRAWPPQKFAEQLRRHLDVNGFGDVVVGLLGHCERPARADVEHLWVRSAVAALVRLMERYGGEAESG
jgi:hypothetical protein